MSRILSARTGVLLICVSGLAITTAAAQQVDRATPKGQWANTLPAIVVSSPKHPQTTPRSRATGGMRSVAVRRSAPPRQATAAPVTPTTAGARRAALPFPFAGGQVARGAQLGLLGNCDYMDTPFSTTSYTDQTIRNMQAAEE